MPESEVSAPEKILLVDDEEGIRKVLGLFLEDLGYSVATAESGEAALKIFSREHPAIVLTDIKMPGMDGIELLRRIKSQRPDTEVIMITGHGEMDLAIESMKLDAADFITKPTNTEVLEIALKRVGEKIDMRRSLQAHTEHLQQLVEETSSRLVAAERQTAVGQVVEGLFAAIGEMAGASNQAFQFFDDLPCFVSVHDQQLKIVAVNPFFRQHIGDFVGRDSWTVYSDANVEKHNCPAARTFRHKACRRGVETMAINGKKTPVSITTAPIRNQNGDIELVLEIAMEVADIQQLRQDLLTTRRHYRELFEAVPCYISVQDRSLRLVEANRRFVDDFGEVSGQHCYEIYKRQDVACNGCPVRKTFEDGQSHHSEMAVQTKDGRTIQVLISTAPIRDHQGQVTRVMEMLTDVTRVYQLQEHLASLGLMIGSVSHSIKGLLTGLDGGLYYLDSGISTQNVEEIEEARGIIGQVGKRIKTMVLDILYYAKESKLNRQPVDIKEFAEDVARTVAAKIQDTPVELETACDVSLAEMTVDGEALHSALLNILDNAVDAVLARRAPEEARIIFRVEQADQWMIFQIVDNGPGMDAGTVEKIFKLFFSTKGKKGTGLGLCIAKKIVEQHGGTITVDSKPGRGTHFTIRIPLGL